MPHFQSQLLAKAPGLLKTKIREMLGKRGHPVLKEL